MSKNTLEARTKQYEAWLAGKDTSTRRKGQTVSPGAFHKPGSTKK